MKTFTLDILQLMSFTNRRIVSLLQNLRVEVSGNGEQRPGPIKNTHAVSSQYNKLIAVYLFSMATPTTLRRDPSIGD